MTKSRKIILGIVAVLLFGYAGYQIFGAATLSVTSEPTEAVVRLDGSLVGDTPQYDFVLTPGVHRLEVEHSHFETFDEQITIGFGERLQRHIVLEQGLARIRHRYASWSRNEPDLVKSSALMIISSCRHGLRAPIAA